MLLPSKGIYTFAFGNISLTLDKQASLSVLPPHEENNTVANTVYSALKRRHVPIRYNLNSDTKK